MPIIQAMEDTSPIFRRTAYNEHPRQSFYKSTKQLITERRWYTSMLVFCGVVSTLSCVGISCSISALVKANRPAASITFPEFDISEEPVVVKKSKLAMWQIPTSNYCFKTSVCWYTASNNWDFGISSGEMTYKEAKRFCVNLRADMVGANALYNQNLQQLTGTYNMSLVDKLTDEDKATFKDAFTSFVTGEDGAPLQIEQIGNVLRKMGQTPTLAEIEEYTLEIDPQFMGEVSYEQMLELYAKTVKSQATLEDEISKAFRTLDKGKNGFIDVTELRHYMTAQGEPLTEDEVDEMISFMDVNGDGKILYEQFIKEEEVQD